MNFPADFFVHQQFSDTFHQFPILPCRILPTQNFPHSQEIYYSDILQCYSFFKECLVFCYNEVYYSCRIDEILDPYLPKNEKFIEIRKSRQII